MSILSRIPLGLVLTTLLSASAPRVALADMPGGGPRCEMERGCVFCENNFEDEGGAGTNACDQAAEADGLIASCGDHTGTYYCPEGVDANAGCSAAGAATQGSAFALSCLAAIGLLATRRGRRPAS
jgi:hypothetical protein